MSYFLAILAAFLMAGQALLIKIGLKNISKVSLIFWTNLISLGFLIPIDKLHQIPLTQLPGNFWLVVLIVFPLDMLAMYFYLQALKKGNISLVSPLLSFTPLLMWLTGWLIIKEIPSIIGGLAILLIVLGTYWLNIDFGNTKFVYTIKKLFHEPGAKYMLATAIIWAITGSFAKLAINYSSAITWSIAYKTVVAFTFLLVIIFKLKEMKKYTRIVWLILLIIGLAGGAEQFFISKALSLTLATYAMAIKRTSILFSILLGWLVLKEEKIKQRLTGAILMIAGIFLISFFT